MLVDGFPSDLMLISLPWELNWVIYWIVALKDYKFLSGEGDILIILSHLWLVWFDRALSKVK